MELCSPGIVPCPHLWGLPQECSVKSLPVSAVADGSSAGGKLLSDTMEAMTRGGRALGAAEFQLWQECAYKFTPTVFLLLMCGLGTVLGLE